MALRSISGLPGEIGAVEMHQIEHVIDEVLLAVLERVLQRRRNR